MTDPALPIAQTPEQQAKIDKIRNVTQTLVSNPAAFEILKDELFKLGFGIRKQVETTPFIEITDPVRIANAQEGILLDCEATGLDHGTDRVFQLGMIRIRYDSQGIISMGERFDRLRDPGIPIPAEVTELTGYTDDMVAGKSISDAEVAEFIGGASKIIAHHAGYDRRMCEASFPGAGFEAVRWDCSFEQVDWKARTMGGAKLELLALRMGFVYGSHDAFNDIQALAHVLGHEDVNGKSGFAEMHERGGEKSLQIVLDLKAMLGGSGYFPDINEKLKERKWVFSKDGSEAQGRPKTWHRTIPETPADIEDEGAFLEDILRKKVALPAYRFDALNRYSNRPPDAATFMRSSQPENVIEALEQHRGIDIAQTAGL